MEQLSEKNETIQNLSKDLDESNDTLLNLQQEYASLWVNYSGVQANLTTLQMDYNTLNISYSSLVVNNSELTRELDNLTEDYDNLQNNLTNYTKDLEDEINLKDGIIQNLTFELNNTNASLLEIQDQYDSLNSNHSSLLTQHNELQSKYNTLNLSYSSLVTKYNDTLTNRTELYDMLNESLQKIQDQIDSLNYWGNRYAHLFRNVTDFFDLMFLRAGLPENQGEFITPYDDDVEWLLEEILGSDMDGDLTWDDIEDIYDFILDRKDYSWDPYAYYAELYYSDEVDYGTYNDYWAYPNETVNHYRNNGVFAGDCEDFTNLFVSLLLAEEMNNYTFGITLDTKPSESGGGHATCFIRLGSSGDEDIWVCDIAGEYYDGNKGSVGDTLKAYGEYWNGKEKVKVWSAYNHHCYSEFDDESEFHEWWRID